jgi:hypothetical protein
MEKELNLAYIVNLIEDYHEASKLNGDEGQYPNSLLITEEQNKILLENMFKLTGLDKQAYEEMVHSVTFICGLKVIITNHLESPKVLRI